MLLPGQNICECEYCGSRQTVPAADNEKKMTLLSRALRLRLSCEFDRAAGIYEQAAAEFPDEPEAWWGIVLCRYGIEYVDDPRSGNKVPTCHRSSFESILSDPDYKKALANADADQAELFQKEAAELERLRRGIIEVSGKEEPYDVFICYKETDASGGRTVDSVLAQDIYDALTEKGYRTFFSRITLEDKLGTEYEPYIFAALNSARVMLVIGTKYEYFDAVWVKNEWSRFLSLISAGQKKTLIPCYRGIDAYDMPQEFSRLQAQDLGKVGALQDLVRGVGKILGRDGVRRQNEYAGVSQQIAESMLDRAKLLMQEGRYEEAVKRYEKMLEIDSRNSDIYLQLEMAIQHVNEASELSRLKEDIPKSANMQHAETFGNDKQKTGVRKIITDWYDYWIAVKKTTLGQLTAEKNALQAEYDTEMQDYQNRMQVLEQKNNEIKTSRSKRKKQFEEEDAILQKKMGRRSAIETTIMGILFVCGFLLSDYLLWCGIKGKNVFQLSTLGKFIANKGVIIASLSGIASRPISSILAVILASIIFCLGGAILLGVGYAILSHLPNFNWNKHYRLQNAYEEEEKGYSDREHQAKKELEEYRDIEEKELAKRAWQIDKNKDKISEKETELQQLEERRERYLAVR